MKILIKSIRIFLILLFVFLIYTFLPRIKINNSLEKWIPDGTAEVLDYKDFLDSFGSDSYVIVAFDLREFGKTEEYEKKLVIFKERAGEISSVNNVLSWPLPFYNHKEQPDPDISCFIITFFPPSHLNPNRPEILEELELLLEEIPVPSHVAGTGVIFEAINQQTKSSTITFLVLGLAILFSILLIILKNFKAFSMSIGISVGGVCTLILSSAIFNIPLSMVSVILPVLILFYSTSTSLHILFHGGNLKKVLVPSLLSALTTSFGFLVFVADPIPLFRDFAVLAISGIIGSLFWTFIFFFPFSYSFEPRKGSQDIFKRIPAHSKPWILLVIVFLMISSIPGIYKLRSDIYSLSVLPPSNKAVEDHFFIERNLGNYFPLEFVVEVDRVKPHELKGWISAVSEFDEIDGAMSYLSFPPLINPRKYGYLSSKDQNLGRVTFLIPLLSTREGMELVKKIELISNSCFTNYSPRITGFVTLYAMVADRLSKSFQNSLLIAFLLVFALIYIYLRDTRIFISSILPNVFPIVLILGLMGWLNIRLDMVTVPIGCLMLSIIVDDSIHFLYWYKKTRDLKSTLISAGPGILNTSIILVSGFAVFIFSSSPPIRYFGLLSIIVMLCALAGDLVLLPIILGIIDKRK